MAACRAVRRGQPAFRARPAAAVLAAALPTGEAASGGIATSGDIDKTAKTVGMSVLEVRGELQALLERRSRDGQEPGGDDGDEPGHAARVAHGADASADEASSVRGSAEPPVAMPPDAPSPVGKAAAKPATAGRARKAV